MKKIFLIIMSGLVVVSLLDLRAFAHCGGLTQPQVFVTPAFEFVLPDRCPQPAEIHPAIQVAAAPGEIRSAAFNLYSDRALPAVTLTVDNLKSGTGASIAGDHIDLRGVKVWKQSGQDLYMTASDPSQGVDVPELLLPETAVEKESTKQFWVTLQVPANAAAGVYRGLLHLRAAGWTQDLPLELTVLPIHLAPSSRINLIYYNGQRAVEQSQWERDIENIVAHGFNAVTIGVPKKAHGIGDLAERMALLHQKGIERVFVIKGTGELSAPLTAAAKSAGLDVVFMGVDEPNTPKKLPGHIALSHELHQVGAKVATPVLKSVADQLEGMGEALDIPIYHADALHRDDPQDRDAALRDYIDGLQQGRIQKKNKPELVYWQAWVENPVLNRLMAGFFLSASSLNGIAAVEYQQGPDKEGKPLAGDPYNDFDNQAPAGRKAKFTYRDMNLVYPSDKGPVPTLQWEALREGINDARYVDALQKKIDELKKTDPAKASALESELRNQLKKYLDPRGADASGRGPLTAADFEKTRQWIVLQLEK